FVAEGANKITGLILVLWLARYFGPESYGKWSFALSYVVIFSLITDFGFGNLIVREVARDRTKMAEYMDNIFFMKIFLGVVTFFLIYIIVQLLHEDAQTITLIYSFGVYIILYSFVSYFQSVFRAREMMQFETFSRVLQNIILILIVIYMLFKKSSIIEMSYSYIIATLFGVIFSLFIILRDDARLFLQINLNTCKQIIKEAWPFALSGIIVTIYLRIGIVFLSMMKNDEAVGLYAAAFNIIVTFAVIPSLFMLSVYPILSRYFNESKEKFIIVYKKCLKLVLFGGIALFSVLFVFSKSIVLAIYDVSYTNAIIIFQLLIVYGFCSFLSCVFMYTLNAMNRQIIYTKVTAFCLVANIALSYVLIQKYSYVGLAAALSVTEICESFLLFIYTNKKINSLRKETLTTLYNS
ncbi:MAG: hypothetical protein C0412_18435, partial [Flavobacterium sp.]|nr:hypothetical protein [Flavobacterium sp.]